jgi:hypothetical protein
MTNLAAIPWVGYPACSHCWLICANLIECSRLKANPPDTFSPDAQGGILDGTNCSGKIQSGGAFPVPDTEIRALEYYHRALLCKKIWLLTPKFERERRLNCDNFSNQFICWLSPTEPSASFHLQISLQKVLDASSRHRKEPLLSLDHAPMLNQISKGSSDLMRPALAR